MKLHMDKQQMRIHYNKEETHMGSWGIEVLENDTALELIPSLVKNGSLKRTVERLLLSAEYIDERLLAVEIVDISLNGIDKSIIGSMYGYEEWFEKLTLQPMAELKEEAIYALEHVKENDLNWFPAYQGARRNLLQKIEARLKSTVHIQEEL